jgi:hypothetical protein
VKKAVLTFAAAAVLTLSAATGSALASAGVSCSTDTSAEVAAASVTNRGFAWSSPAQPNPLWTVSLDDLNSTVDVYAADESGARAAAKSYLDGQVAALNCAGTPAPAPTATPPTGDTPPNGTTTTPAAPTASWTAQASDLAASASVTYVGNSWGPVPVYRVSVSSLNLTLDVNANSEGEARTAAIPTIASMLARSGAAPDPTVAAAPPATAPAADPAPAATTAPTVVGDASQAALDTSIASGADPALAALAARSAGENALYGLAA